MGFTITNEGAIPTSMRNQAHLFLGVLTMLLSASASTASALEGVANVQIEIEGKSYSVPMANKDYQADFYLFRKAVAGDKDAFEVILGKSDEKWFYIGDYQPLWAKITRYKVEVIDPKEKAHD